MVCHMDALCVSCEGLGLRNRVCVEFFSSQVHCISTTQNIMTSTTASEQIIDGIAFYPQAIIPHDKGSVLHMLKAGISHMGVFGEIYFSEIYPQCIKAWKYHKEMTQRICVPMGEVHLVIYDGRESSPSFQKLFEIDLGRQSQYGVLIIPPRVWYGFENRGMEVALIVNCTDMPHDPDESIRIPMDSESIPYVWSLQMESG